MGKKGCQLRVRKGEQVLEVWGIRGKQRCGEISSFLLSTVQELAWEKGSQDSRHGVELALCTQPSVYGI